MPISILKHTLFLGRRFYVHRKDGSRPTHQNVVVYFRCKGAPFPSTLPDTDLRLTPGGISQTAAHMHAPGPAGSTQLAGCCLSVRLASAAFLSAPSLQTTGRAARGANPGPVPGGHGLPMSQPPALSTERPSQALQNAVFLGETRNLPSDLSVFLSILPN